MNPLLDHKFLYDLDRHHNRVTYVRITSLTLGGLPVEQIEGVATGGSITIDGSSSVRRICNLTMSTKNLNINRVYWGITTRVRVELGLKNDIVGYEKYDNIIWFPMGTYVLNEFKTSSQVNNYTITLSGKDKMCLLNGDISGQFNAETDLGTEEVWSEELKTFIKEKRPIDYIIREMVHHYAQEDFANIIIKDIKHSLEILTNRTGHNIYIIRKMTNGEVEEIITDLTHESNYFYMDDSVIDFSTLADNQDFQFQVMVDEDDIALVKTDYAPTLIKKENAFFTVGLIANGDDLGYRVMSTEFPEDLIAAIGDTVTSVLDKIIKYFTNYEYFYNASGQFIFQEKQTYVNTAWNGVIRQDKENYVDPSLVRSKVVYSFEGSNLVNANQNTPNIGKIKNDYTVWGKKKTASGKEYPIHMRYAIDLKPKAYKTYDDIIYSTEEFANNLTAFNNVKIVDWREIIYQMALDYYAHNHDDDYAIRLRQNNYLSAGINLYPTGRTGYEQYYHDIQGFWRLLYIPVTEREEYFSKSRILSGFAARKVTGFEWTENGYNYNKEEAKIIDVKENLDYKEYYIDTDEVGTLKSVENDEVLVDKDNVTYTLQLLIQRDKIIDDTIAKQDNNEKQLEELQKERLKPDADKDTIDQQIEELIKLRREIQKEIDIATTAIAPYKFSYICDKNEEDFYKKVTYTTSGFPLYENDENFDKTYQGYNKNIFIDPSSLIFWFDFFDADSLGLGQFSIPAIGDRPKAINNDAIRALIYQDVPDIIFINEEDYESVNTENSILDGYTNIILKQPEKTLEKYRYELLEKAETEEEKAIIQERIDTNAIELEEEGLDRLGFWRWFMDCGKIYRSARSTTAQEEIDNLLYDTAYCNENITITSVPIYYLIPNTIISADDEQRNIGGYYILDKMTIPLNYNGTMQSTAIKVPERIY